MNRFQWLNALRADRTPELAAIPRLVAVMLWSHGDSTMQAHPSLSTLCEECALSKNPVRNALDTLESLGWIERNKIKIPRGFRYSYTFTVPEGVTCSPLKGSPPHPLETGKGSPPHPMGSPPHPLGVTCSPLKGSPPHPQHTENNKGDSSARAREGEEKTRESEWNTEKTPHNPATTRDEKIRQRFADANLELSIGASMAIAQAGILHFENEEEHLAFISSKIGAMCGDYDTRQIRRAVTDVGDMREFKARLKEHGMPGNELDEWFP